MRRPKLDDVRRSRPWRPEARRSGRYQRARNTTIVSDCPSCGQVCEDNKDGAGTAKRVRVGTREQNPKQQLPGMPILPTPPWGARGASACIMFTMTTPWQVNQESLPCMKHYYGAARSCAEVARLYEARTNTEVHIVVCPFVCP